MDTQRHRSPVRGTAIVIGMVLLTALGLMLVYETRRVLTWIVIAAFIATALHPVTNWVQRRAAWCKRWLSTLIVFLAVFLALAGLVTLFVVPLVREGAQLADELPRLVSEARAGRGPVGEVVQRFHVDRYLQQHSDQLRQNASGLGASAVAFVLAYLMVLEAPRLIDAFLALFEPRRAERIRRVGTDCAKTITGYLSGNLLISVICGILTYVVLLVLGVPFAGLIA